MMYPLWNFFFAIYAIYAILQVIWYIHFLWNTEPLSSWPHVQSIQYQQPESIDVLLSINESSQQSISFIIILAIGGNLFPLWGLGKCLGNDHLHLLWNPLNLFSMQFTWKEEMDQQEPSMQWMRVPPKDLQSFAPIHTFSKEDLIWIRTLSKRGAECRLRDIAS